MLIDSDSVQSIAVGHHLRITLLKEMRGPFSKALKGTLSGLRPSCVLICFVSLLDLKSLQLRRFGLLQAGDTGLSIYLTAITSISRPA